VIRPRSIKSKLKWWVVIIFVLTGTAGWAGIWGLFYISSRITGLSGPALGGVATQTAQIHEWILALQVALFVTVLLCQAFSAWAGWHLSRSLTSELNALKESAERISLGDLKSEVNVATADVEIVAVGEALDRLRVSLGKAMDRLAAKRAAAHG